MCSIFTEPNTISQRQSCESQHIYSNITIQHNPIEPQLEDFENKTVSEQKPDKNIVEDIEEPDVPRKLHQLYGKDFNEDGETMVLLRNGVFCKSSVLHNALGSSTKTTHLVRKLVLGVFKKEIFKKRSIQVTGNTPRSVEKQPGAKYDNIDVVARSAIIKYAKAIGKLTKWPYVHTKDLTLRIERCLKGLVNSSVKPIPTNAIKHF
ncbi:hypothetical protein DMN91_006118 [Ooceraea biroi]|uniref:BEN domain-containing protein n=1 Tax=Ooceraea biroi TaxID=2015173 RepID=A0A3L8DNE3_OOCBI|nr:hypothetical protein DMN91_006118 [Ooceraea biroi]